MKNLRRELDDYPNLKEGYLRKKLHFYGVNMKNSDFPQEYEQIISIAGILRVINREKQ